LDTRPVQPFVKELFFAESGVGTSIWCNMKARSNPSVTRKTCISLFPALRIVVEVDQRVAVVDLDVEKLRHVKFQGRVVNGNLRKLIITDEVHPSPW
jgi:hypothetical protein